MKKLFYFSVTADNGSGEHIGTICATTDEELKAKLITACMEHFDEDVEITGDIKIENFMYGRTGDDIGIKVGDYDDAVSICQTWLY